MVVVFMMRFSVNSKKMVIQQITMKSILITMVMMILKKNTKIMKSRKNWLKNSLGTLGGGNHFIEIDRSEDGTGTA